MRLFIDFETRSKCDLRRFGADNYAKDPSTEVLCMAYAADNGPTFLATPGLKGWHLPFATLDEDWHGPKQMEVWGHNVGGFEWYIWNNVCVPKYGWPKLNIEQCYDTMAMAAQMGFPLDLAGCANAAGLQHKKDSLGHRVMMKLSQPKKDGTFYDPKECPEDFKLLYDYCKQDVEVEREISKRLAPLPEKERKIWVLDQKINQRGVGIDIFSARNIHDIVGMEGERLNGELQKITGGAVGSFNQHAKFKKWCESRTGETYESIDKEAVKEILKTNVPKEVRRAIEIRQEGAKSSNAKYDAMLDCQNGGRARNLFQYHGAATGRWAGRKIQLQNLPRSKISADEVSAAIQSFNSGKTASLELLHGSVTNVASDCIRGCIIPDDGKTFLCADFSNIEGRGLVWLSGEEWKLQFFRDLDEGKIKYDNYIASYAKAFGRKPETVTKDERQIGKVMELACGYGGGAGAFQTMAKGYGVTVPDSKAEDLKTAWRQAHPRTVSYWYLLEEAAIKAIKNPKTVFVVHPKGGARVEYVKKGSFLVCKLPSGRNLYYPYPLVELVETPWGEKKLGITYMSVNSLTRQFTRDKTYGGSLCENITQAICRDVLADAMLRVEDAGFPIVMHVHDEIVSEFPETNDPAWLNIFEYKMSKVPDWARGFPIIAKGWSGSRYRKE